MSTTPTVINLNDTTPASPNGEILVKWQGDASNPRNTSAYVPIATATSPGAVQLVGDVGGGASLVVQGVTGIAIDTSESVTEDFEALRFVVDSVSDSGAVLGHLKFGHLSGGVDARITATETIDKDSFAACVTFADVSPASNVAVSLDSTVNAHFWCFAQNNTSSHTVTFTPTSGSINVSTLSSGAAGVLLFDGTDWLLLSFGSGGGGSAAAWYVGAGAPSTLHNNGDFYLNSTNGDVYEQVSGSWGSPVANIKGATGATGATGSTGATGAAGPAPSGTGFVRVTSGVLENPATITLDTDGTLAANSDSKIPSQKAVKTFVAANIATPLTTKGDLYTFDTGATRIPVGSNGQVLIADSAQTSGLKWDSVGTITGGYSNAPPVEANFSWINQGAYAFSGGTSVPTVFYAPSGATGVNLHCRVMTAPATPYSFKIRGSAKSGAGGGVIWRFGIVVRDSATGKMVTIDIDVNAAWFTNGHIGSPHVIKWNSATSFSAFYSPSALLGVNGVDFRYINFKVVNDGTNLKWYVDPLKQQGGDSENWQLIQTNLKNDFLGNIDQVGYFSDNEGTGSFVSQIYDWIQGTS
jgi:hypothetical protein